MKRRLYKCNICDSNFSQKGNLKQHIDSIHIGIKRHKCNSCKFAASGKGELNRHINAVHEGKKNHSNGVFVMLNLQ